jgi:hypothetical protein
VRWRRQWWRRFNRHSGDNGRHIHLYGDGNRNSLGDPGAHNHLHADRKLVCSGRLTDWPFPKEGPICLADFWVLIQVFRPRRLPVPTPPCPCGAQ